MIFCTALLSACAAVENNRRYKPGLDNGNVCQPGILL